MPLASSREASVHRAKLVQTEKKEEARRQRLSLPHSIDSTTCVNERKAERRRSLRRQSSSGSLKENKAETTTRQALNPDNNNKKSVPRLPPPVRSPGPTPYYQVAEERGGVLSPRTTRSHSKKAKDEEQKDDANIAPGEEEDASTKETNGGGLVLVFSPPNQAENARREAEQVKRKEEERMRRIKRAQASGQLLVFPLSNRELVIPQFDEDIEMKPVKDISPETSSQFCLDLSPPCARLVHPAKERNNSSERNNDSAAHESKSASQEVGLDRRTVDELKEFLVEQIKSSGMDRSQQEAQLVENATLVALNKKLEQTSEMLQQNIKNLQEELTCSKEMHLVERVKLEALAEATQIESKKLLEQLEIRCQHLEDQNGLLREEKHDLKVKREELEKEVSKLRDNLQESHSLLNSLRAELASTKDHYESEVDRLEHVNLDLTEQVGEVSACREELEQAADTYERRIQELERSIKEYQSRVEDTAALLNQEREAKETVQRSNVDMETEIAQLKNDVQKLAEENETERQGFQKLNEDSTKALARLQEETTAKDTQIGSLFKQLGDLQQTTNAERIDIQESQEKLQLVHDEMKEQISELNNALDEAMAQLDNVESERNELKEKLADAVQRLDEASATQSAIQSTKIQALASAKEIQESLMEEGRRRGEAEARVAKLEQQLMVTAEERDAAGSTMRGYVSELERQLKITAEERDAARSNMQGYDQREVDLYRKLRESDRIRQEMHAKLMKLMGSIRVFVRVRPPLPGEVEKELPPSQAVIDARKRKRDDVDIPDGETPFRFPGVYDRAEKKINSQSSSDDVTKNLIEVREPHRDRGGLKDRRKKWTFGFDKVFSPDHGQDDVWEATEPLIQCAVDGYNVTIFAYGQTGSGKTYTMLGDPDNEGIIGRAVKKLFQAKSEIQSLSRGESEVFISVELLEVYNEKVRDLLAPDTGPEGRELALKVTSKEVIGNIVVSTNTEEEVMRVLEIAQSRRCVKATNSNLESSRSHMLFTIHFDVTNADGAHRRGKLNICDLAGSERLGKSGTHLVGGALLEETKHINLSLSVLSNVIERLQAGDANVPFRDSKLTFLLKDSLSGNSKTLAIVCCNPLFSHVSESISSLRFAEKVNRVDLKAMANFSF